MQSLWDRIAATPEQVAVPEWHREILDERLKDYEANPNAGESWTLSENGFATNCVSRSARR